VKIVTFVTQITITEEHQVGRFWLNIFMRQPIA